MSRKRPILISDKGQLFKLTDGPLAGTKLRLGQTLPHPKGTVGRTIPLPDRMAYPQHGGAYVKHVTDTGEVIYRWKRSRPSTTPSR